MSAIDASIAARVRGPMPRGFSLEASLMMPSSFSPSSRASSESGLPGWYGAIERTYEGDSSQRSISMKARWHACSTHRHGIRAQDFKQRRLRFQAFERLRHLRVGLVALDVDEEHVFPHA